MMLSEGTQGIDNMFTLLDGASTSLLLTGKETY